MTVVPDQQIRLWRERYGADLAAAAAGREETVAWWAGLGEDEPFLESDGRGGWLLTEAGSKFEGLFWADVAEGLVAEIIAASDGAGASGRISPGIRGSLPAAAFYQALGAADSARMPGGLADFLVAADEVAAGLGEVERLLADGRREELAARVDRWLDCADSGAASQGRQMVDGLLQVFRLAAERGWGVAACSVFF